MIFRNKPLLFTWNVSIIITVVVFAIGDIHNFESILILSWSLSLIGILLQFLDVFPKEKKLRRGEHDA